MKIAACRALLCPTKHHLQADRNTARTHSLAARPFSVKDAEDTIDDENNGLPRKYHLRPGAKR